MSKVDTAIQSIITHQEDVVGPLAFEQANAVAGITVDASGKVKVTLKKPSDSKALLNKLVKKYAQLFGQASVEVCKDAIKKAGISLKEDELPDILK